MKSNNTIKNIPLGNTKAVSTGTVTPGIKSNKNRHEDQEFIRRMNEFTKIAGLLSEDPFYEVL